MKLRVSKEVVRAVLLVSGLCLLALGTASRAVPVRFSLWAAALWLLGVWLLPVEGLPLRRRDRGAAVWAGILCLMLGLMFRANWYYSDYMWSLGDRVGVNGKLLGEAFALCFAAGAFPIVLYVMRRQPREATAPEAPCTARVRAGEFWFLFALGAVCVTLFSRSSPLYPLNDWVDSNCFFTVGKSVLRGVVPYRDLYEQKGPLLYFLHTLAACVSFRSFLGVYLLEVLAAAGYLYYGYRTLRLYASARVLPLMALVAALTYGSWSFCMGDSAEELCLPLLSYGLFQILRTVRGREALSGRDAALLGASAAAIFWIKYTILAPYIALVLIVIARYVIERKFLELLRLALLAIAGFAALSLPIGIYFAAHGALGDLWTVYFYNNLFLYGENNKPVLVRLFQHHRQMMQIDPRIYAMTALGIAALWRRDARAGLTLTVCAGIAAAALFAIPLFIEYYGLALYLFAPFSVLWLEGAVTYAREGKPRRYALAALTAALVVLICSGSTNIRAIGTPRGDLPQYRFRNLICAADEPTLLNYGFLDGGFYTTTGIVPTERFFCFLNIPLPELQEEMDAAVAEGRTQFVVTRNAPLESERYELVDEADGGGFHYYLYERK